ncbi:MAG: TerB family tellurite resistance protein [Spirochaetia bacterium]|jgi:uncharacterized protein (DUF697 family)|nr:TerB family tellurite resistance protein [Spirochaetia bacterium]
MKRKSISPKKEKSDILIKNTGSTLKDKLISKYKSDSYKKAEVYTKLLLEKKIKLQESLTNGMMSIFNSVRQNKEKEYKRKEAEPIHKDVEQLISKCSTANALISGGAGLIPGPWGMLAVAPEITLIIKNQIEMVYDIGKAYGKENKELTTELLVGIFASASGSAGIGLLTIHGSKILVKQVSLRVMQRIITMLGGKVTQRVIKSMVAKWLPGVGALAMAAWSRYTTRLVGKKAIEYLSKEIIIDDKETLVIKTEFEIIADISEDTQEKINRNKIILLTNLMKIDNNVAPEEVDHISKIIMGMDLSEDVTEELLGMINSSEKGKVDFTVLVDNDEAMSILIDMVALAKADNDFHALEKVYIKQVGRNLNFPDEDIIDILNIE